MTAAPFPTRAALASLIGALVILSACAEREVILPGKREALRAQAGEDAEATAAIVQNTSRPIRLASQSRNAQWAQPIGTQANRTAHPALRMPPQLVWSTRIGEGDGRRVRITADPVVAGGLIYTLDSGAQVSAVTPAGAVAWQTDLTPSSDDEGEATGGGMAYDKGTLYVSLGFGTLAAIDARSGAVRWRQRLDATGSGTPTIRDNLIYLVAGDDTGWAIETDTGRVAWQIDAAPSVANVLGAPAPALVDGLAVFAFGSGDIIATFRKGGLRRWNATVSGQRQGRAAARIGDITGSPVVVGDRIYTGNHSGRLVALSASTGDRIWTAQEGALGPVWPAGDSIFAVTDLNQLVRINASDGSVIWAVDLPRFVKDKPRKRAEVFAHYGPVLAGGRLVVASNDGALRFFAPENGALTNTVEVPDGATTSPVVAGGTLYLVSTTGQLLAFR